MSQHLRKEKSWICTRVSNYWSLAWDLDSNHPILNLTTKPTLLKDTHGLCSSTVIKALIRQVNTDGQLAGYSAMLWGFRRAPLCHVMLSRRVSPQGGLWEMQSICGKIVLILKNEYFRMHLPLGSPFPMSLLLSPGVEYSGVFLLHTGSARMCPNCFRQNS